MLTPGTRLGHYDVQTLIGQGGMGEVYRASDTRLKRDVAVKILPETFAADTERLARFEREAQLLASLNHPHIAAIYGIEESNGVRAIVMELVEGPTLAERIAQGPIPLDETFTIAAQIAEALDVAHSAGIIHRDLKPANIKLRPDGAVKVLDFGLAKGAPVGGSSVGSASVILNSPTITSPVMTMQGVILGTAAYMSPEQAKGKPVDKRADIWAFGVIVYEMLTGERLYVGDDVSETLASIIKSDPDWGRLPSDTPPTIRRLLKRCLAKDAKLRLHDAGDALLDIRDAMSGADEVSKLVEASPVTRVRQRLLFVASLVAAIAVGATAMWFMSRQDSATPTPIRRFSIVLPETDSFPVSRGRVVAVSPDGKTIVYRANNDPGGKLFRRSLNQFDAAVLPNTEGGSDPFFSPDGRWVAFLAARDLKKVPLAGGAVETIVPQQAIRGAWWTLDGRILYGTNEPNGKLMQVSAAGGEPTMLLRLSDERRLWYPQPLNNETDVLFTASEASANAGELRVVRLNTGEQRTLLPRAVAGRVLPTGDLLVFVRDSGLWAVRFDSARLEIIGEPQRVVPNVRIEIGGAVQFDVAHDGSLFYIAGGDALENRSVLVAGATGEAQRTPLPLREYNTVGLSADATRAALQIGEADNADVWVGDINRGTLVRLTSESGYDGQPAWTPDQRQVVFAVARKGQWSIQRKSADGTGDVETLVTFDQDIGAVRPASWSPDGTMLAFDYRTSNTNDIGLLTMSDRKWRPLIASPPNEMAAAISPDGRWIAYQSFETGQPEVYVQRFPSLGDRQMVSVGGGLIPVWTANGRSLTYLRGTPPTAVMRATFKTTADGTIVFSSPEQFRPYSFFSKPGFIRTYDVSRDGNRLLVIGTADAPATVQRQMNVITNWYEELKTLVPVR